MPGKRFEKKLIQLLVVLSSVCLKLTPELSGYFEV
jgi:hypothetical protein